MHQSGQLRAHSMQTVQFSSRRAMTPRARGAGSSFSWGYCTVTAPRVGDGIGVSAPRFGNMVWTTSFIVTPSPLTRPTPFTLGKSGIRAASRASEGDLQDHDHEDVHQ